jgi:DNA-binding transcriptional LysR family regulator
MSQLFKIESFVTVARMGSFVKAAKVLGITASMLSRRIADLEETLHVRLIERTTRTMVLTDCGVTYLERCTAILALLEQADSEVRSSAGELSGVLRISAPMAFGIGVFVALWGDFETLYPQIKLDIHLSDAPLSTMAMTADVCLRMGAAEPSDMAMRSLASVQMVLCAAPSYFKQHALIYQPKDISEGSGHRVVICTDTYGDTAHGSGELWTFIDVQGGKHVVSAAGLPGIRCNVSETCVALALDGQGLLYAPLFCVENHLSSGGLKRALTHYQSAPLSIQALYPSNKHLNSKVRTMLDYLSQTLESKRWG